MKSASLKTEFGETVNLAAFPLTTPTEIAHFEKNLDEYLHVKTNGPAVVHFSLPEAFSVLQGNPNGGRLFAALVDIRISLALLFCDSIALGRELNKTMPDKLAESSPLTKFQAFQIRMEMHAHANAFILRFRSLWDKFMGLMVLRFAPQEYQAFSGANSRKASFRRIMAEHPAMPKGFVSTAETLIQEFDDLHRTSEAHGTGKLRKSSFVWTDHTDSPPVALLGYWNFVNEIALVLGSVFDLKARKKLSQARTERADPA